MQTKFPKDLLDSPIGKKADKILRSCVHCGFCLATCPTYQLHGNELDSPRGRIYLIKSALEQNNISQKSLAHLDTCLTCRSCETTCPSGVEYSELVDIGRQFLEHQRPLWQKVSRYTIRKLLTQPKFVQLIAPLAAHSNITSKSHSPSPSPSKGKVLLLSGCVQPSLTPNTNHVTKNVLARLDYDVVETPQQCCGAIDHHAAAHKDSIAKVKHNIDQWLALLEADVDAIISTASGCGVMVKDYPTLFDANDDYQHKAQVVADNSFDIAEFLSSLDLSGLKVVDKRISYHAPCTLQHGQKLPGIVEKLLTQLGYDLSPVTDAHLCCGSAGTYSLFQPKISQQLRNNKVNNLTQSQPDLIVTSNIGCQMHIANGTDIPVKHWIELFDD